MIFSSRLRLIGSFILLLSFTILNLGAQALDVPLPFDNRIKTGTLPNGMRYYIQPNAKPEKKVELRLAVMLVPFLKMTISKGWLISSNT